jgi:hypothetical protein
MRPSPEILRSVFTYDEVSGNLIFKRRPISMFEGGQRPLNSMSLWNATWEGRVAGSMNDRGYIRVSVFGKQYLAHKVIFAMRDGEWPISEIDHINGNPSDNRLCNLRFVSRVENMQNMAISSRNKSGALGVFWDTQRGKWSATIKVNDKIIYLGSFIDVASAAVARKVAERKYGFHPNHGRKS